MIWLSPLLLLWFYMAYSAAELAKERGTLTGFIKYAGYYPVLVIGGLLDVAINVVVCIVIFWDVPREFTLTKSVSRMKDADGHKGQFARWLRNELNSVLPGHCK